MGKPEKTGDKTANKENRIKVEIFGESYILKGNETVEYMQMLAQYVDEKVRQTVAFNPRLGIVWASLLAALNIADELMKLQKKYDQLVNLKELKQEKSPELDRSLERNLTL